MKGVNKKQATLRPKAGKANRELMVSRERRKMPLRGPVGNKERASELPRIYGLAGLARVKPLGLPEMNRTVDHLYFSQLIAELWQISATTQPARIPRRRHGPTTLWDGWNASR